MSISDRSSDGCSSDLGAGFELLTLLCPCPRDAFCERQRGGCQQGTSGRSNWAAVESYAKAFVLRNSGGFRVETFHGLTSSFPPRRIENGRESPQLSSRCGGRRAPGAGKKAGYDDGLEHADAGDDCAHDLRLLRSEEYTSELQSLLRISYAVFCLKKK